MNILVCIKRVPDIGAKVELTEDQRAIVTKNLGFTISPHEECAVEEAVQRIEKDGGDTTVLTLGPEGAEEQIRDSLARGVERGILLETDGNEWDPGETAQAILEAIRAQQEAGDAYDLFLFGNEAADTGDFQVAVRVAHALGLPCVTGVPQATTMIKTGNALTVDGYLGIVTIGETGALTLQKEVYNGG